MSSNESPDKETLEQWHKDPANWILGIFYFNPKDKRLLPPKRISAMGWTVNFANPYSVFILIGILVLISAITFIPGIFKNR
ncbi:MAG: DUF5808 domain-containing protein [Bacteroidia bacterium]